MTPKGNTKRATRAAEKKPGPTSSKRNRSDTDPSGTEPLLPIVGIVASAGGLQAFIKFLEALPNDSGIAFVLIPHLDPRRKSLMSEVLSHHSRVPVVTAEDGQRVAVNNIYVIPPNRFMTIHEGTFSLTAPANANAIQTVMDVFLRSLAEDQQEKAVGIVLSGTGSSGTLGIKAIKANGGMVMVQDPKTAEQDSMPTSAIATGLADYVQPPEQMPKTLIRYARNFLTGAPAEELGPPATPDTLTQVLALLRARTKFDFRSYRRRTLLRRIQRRMGLANLSDMADYLALLRDNPEEVKRLSRDLFIPVTSFFRDREVFQILETQIIPELLRTRPPDVPLRVWVPACATGEEAYSIAMLFLEQIAASGKAFTLQVFASDVDPDTLEVARQGVYSDSVLSDVSAERLTRFFTRVDANTHQVNKTLRETVLFAQQNILSDAPFSRIDLVSCRNLLIYLESEVQQKVVSLLHFALNDGGYLVLGPSETVGASADAFDAVSKKWRIYRRHAMLRPGRVDFPIEPRGGRGQPKTAPPAPTTARAISAAELTQSGLLEDFAPASVLIRRNYEVLYFHGPTGLYLQQPSGHPTQDLAALAGDGLRARIRAAVHKAQRENRRVTVTGGRVKRGRAYVAVRVSARPLYPKAGTEGLMLVSFEDENEVRTAATLRPRGKTAVAHEDLVQQLERELKSTRGDLQSTIEDLETANEELKASHEEVTSMNEELQSANEELETSKEELQSLNEELTTVNSQLQEKVHELENTGNDLSNLLASTDTATLFLGPDHTIKRFTDAATRVFRLIATDVGRPVGDITWRFADPGLEADIDAVLQSLTPREKEISTEDGRWCLRRITPYRTTDNRIEGVVVTFVDITALKQAESALRELNADLEERVKSRTIQLLDERNFVSEVLGSMRALVLVTDPQGRIERFNRACERVSGRSLEDVRGKTPFETIIAPEEAESVRALFAALRVGETIETRSENTWLHTDGSRHIISWTNSVLRDGEGTVQHIIRTGIEITELRAAEEESRQRQAALTHAHRLSTAGELAATLAHELNQPLAAILNYSEGGATLLRSEGVSVGKLAPAFEQISMQARRAADTIRELRAFLAKEERPKSAVDLNELVRKSSDLLAGAAKAHGIRIEHVLADGLPRVSAVEIHIEHVLVNLMQNAIEAMGDASAPRSGVVTVTTRQPAEGMVLLSVEDTGPGLDPEKAARIFEPFQTTKKEGLGMGLAICRTIVEAHGGKIWAEVGSGPGASFHVTLPIAP